jgi:hypothetical protein
MAGGTLTPGAVSGKNILFTSSTSVFFTSDVGRIIIYKASRAVIVSFGASAGDTTSPNTNVRADILDVFPDTNPILSGLWLMRLSPQSALDPDKKEPVGAQIILVANKPTFREQDVGKFIAIYGGLVRIKSVDSVTQVTGQILTSLQVTATDPPAAPAGSWTLEEPSWSDAHGFPRTGEFFQGRLAQAGSNAQPTTFWLSQSDAYDKYAIGIKASDAIEYTIASRQLNRIEWLADNMDLLIGTTGTELVAKSGKSDNEPLGGDVIPRVDKSTNYGSAGIQPIVIAGRLLFVDRSLLQIYGQAFDFASNGYLTEEITAIADHITRPGLRLGPIVLQKRLDSRLFFVRQDGELVTLTYFVNQKVVGFTRFTTDGTFESVASIPQVTPALDTQPLLGIPDQVWVIVKRVINGATKRYVELFIDGTQTDSSTYFFSSPGVPTITVISALDYLEGKTVDVVADGSYVGTHVVAGGQITLIEAASEVQLGLHYDSTVTTMRPAVEGSIIEGLPRSWDKLYVRLLESMGGHINGEPIQYSATNPLELFTGDREVTGQGWDTDGRVTIQQRLPYPFVVLALFGTLSVGDND